MLADIMRETGGGPIEQHGTVGEAGDEFEEVGVFHGRGGSLAPGEGSVPCDQDSGDGEGVEFAILKEAGNDGAGIEDVGFLDFGGGERLGDGDFAMEVVSVGGAEAGDGTAGLSPGGGELGVGVDDAADLREFAVEQEVGIEVAGRIQRAFHNGAVKGGQDQVAGGHGGVGNAAGLDENERAGTVEAGAVNATDVAKSVEGEPTAGDFLVSVEDLLAQFWEEHEGS